MYQPLKSITFLVKHWRNCLCVCVGVCFTRLFSESVCLSLHWEVYMHICFDACMFANVPVCAYRECVQCGDGSMGSWYWQESGCGSRWQQSPGIKQQRRNRGSSPGLNANLTLISLFLFCWLLFPLACFTHSFLSKLSLLMSPHLNLRCYCVHSFS